jgi:histidine triad (HIT) family protein
MADCIFCKIIAGQIPGELVYQDDKVVAFKDINPEAPVHLLIVPREHIASVTDVKTEKQAGLVGHMVLVGNKLAQTNGVKDRGFRLIINVGTDGGQVVQHLHMHLLGGRPLVNRMG